MFVNKKLLFGIIGLLTYNAAYAMQTPSLKTALEASQKGDLSLLKELCFTEYKAFTQAKSDTDIFLLAQAYVRAVYADGVKAAEEALKQNDTAQARALLAGVYNELHSFNTAITSNKPLISASIGFQRKVLAAITAKK